MPSEDQMITVKLFGLVRLETGIKELQVSAEDLRQLQKVLTRWIPEEKIKGCVFLVNGKRTGSRTKLQDGDEVMMMPPVAGG